jgi:hypothetical protein
VKNSADTPTAICIAGAHRSGTSIVTRLLHRCGFELGPESDLMPPQADNPDGFWEHLGFVRLVPGDLPPKSDENFADTLTHERTAAARKIQFGKPLGLEGSTQLFDTAILGRRLSLKIN